MMESKSSVRWFHSDQAGAPQIDANAGNIISILDACLLDGYGLKSVDGIVVSSEVATVTISSGHDFEPYSVVRIQGATQSDLNDDWPVITADGSTFTFACPGVADVTASGTMTALRAPPGYWAKEFSAANFAAYRSSHPSGAHYFLQVDDRAAGAGLTPVRGYSSMSAVDVGQDPFPAISEDLNWSRSRLTGASNLPRPWTMICDGAFFHLLLDWAVDASYPSTLHQFGLLGDANPLDGGATILTGHANTNPWFNDPPTTTNLNGSQSYGAWFASNLAGTQPIECALVGSGITFDINGDFAYPNDYSGGSLYHSPVLALGSGVRGSIPGLLQSLTARVTTMAGAQNERRIINATATSPAVLLIDVVGQSYNTRRYAAFDIQGPWR
jgi:hypothetical protein